MRWLPGLTVLLAASLLCPPALANGVAVRNESAQNWTLKLDEKLSKGELQVFENEIPDARTEPKATLATGKTELLLKAKHYYVFRAKEVDAGKAIRLKLLDPSGKRCLLLEGSLDPKKKAWFKKFTPLEYQSFSYEEAWKSLPWSARPSWEFVTDVVEKNNLAEGTIVIMGDAFKPPASLP